MVILVYEGLEHEDLSDIGIRCFAGIVRAETPPIAPGTLSLWNSIHPYTPGLVLVSKKSHIDVLKPIVLIDSTE